MLGLSLEFWRHLRIALPSEAWSAFLAEVRQYHGCGGIIGCVAEARFSIAQAVCWLAHDYGGSEFDVLRCADNLTGYQPGPLERGTSEDRDYLAHSLYTLCAAHLAKVTQ